MASNFEPNDEDPLLPDHMQQVLMRWTARSAGTSLLLVSGALWLTLVTWQVTDPSLTHAVAGQTRNLFGPPGAIVSDLMLQVLGFAAVLLLLGPIALGLHLLFGSGDGDTARVRPLVFLVGVMLAAGGFSAVPVQENWPLEHGFGGFAGDLVLSLATMATATVLPFGASFVAGLVLFAGGIWLAARAIGIEALALGAAWAEVAENLIGRLRRTRAAAGAVASGFQRREPDLKPSAARQPADWEHPAPDLDLSDDAAGGDTAPLPSFLREEDKEPKPKSSFWSRRSADRRTQPQPCARSRADATARADDQAGAAEHDDADPLPALFVRDHAKLGAEAAKARVNGLARQQAADGSDGADHQAGRIARAPMTELDALCDLRGPIDGDALARSGKRGPLPCNAQPEADQHADCDAGSGDAVVAAAGTLPCEAPSDALRDGARTAGLGPGAVCHGGGYRPPSLSLLSEPKPSARAGQAVTQTVLRGSARLLEDTLSDFGVKGAIREIRPGPVITLFAFEPARGIKASRVIGLADDIARSMSAPSARIATIPGTNLLGIELPNAKRETVTLREILEHGLFRGHAGRLPIALGKSIDGEPVVADLAAMPHVLVAGTTGSGKSVGINAMILSLIFRHAPEDCRLLLIDPKMLELSVYNGIPHLLTPVVTEPEKAVAALKWAVREMEERYKRMADLGVRNIAIYNNRVRNAAKRGDALSRPVQTGFDRVTGDAVLETRDVHAAPLPQIVIVVDEFADLMGEAGKDIEAAVQRLAQMARAAGIHLIMATQRPSVDVVTGTIKANFPSRIAFKVASKVDSRTIINGQGAEQLLGQGDMLLANGGGQLVRVHGAFVSDDDVEAVTDAMRASGGPAYVDEIFLDDADGPRGGASLEAGSVGEDLYARAVAIVMRDRRATTSYVQRRLEIGYNRAASLIERMEADGLIGPPGPNGKREIH